MLNPRIPSCSRRVLPAVAAGVVAAGALAACGSGPTKGASGPATAGQAKTAAAAKKVPLVIYAAEGYDAAEGKAFQAATGIPTTVDDNSTGPLITKVEAERNNPQWDLMWTDGATEFAAFDTQHLLVRGFEPSAHYNSLGRSLVPKDRSYIPTGVTMAAALIYDTRTSPTRRRPGRSCSRRSGKARWA